MPGSVIAIAYMVSPETKPGIQRFELLGGAEPSR